MDNPNIITRRSMLLGALAAPLALSACAASPELTQAPGPSSADTRPTTLGIEVKRSIAHDKRAFTQGLTLLEDGRLVESTGGYGSSSLRILDRATGEVLSSIALPKDEFGEGVDVVDGIAHQLTWRSGVLHRWKLEDMTELEPLEYQGEGWGLCHDTDTGHLWRSDGTNKLIEHRVEDFSPTGRVVSVAIESKNVNELNELEFVDGQIWANVWKTERAVRIDPNTQEVTAVLDATMLRSLAVAGGLDTSDKNAVLNGIAHDPATGDLLMTGKRWPLMFEVATTSA